MRKFKRILSKVFVDALLLFTTVISIFPVIWVIMSAFKTNAQILSSPYSLPTRINFEAFSYIFSKYNFFRYFIKNNINNIF